MAGNTWEFLLSSLDVHILLPGTCKLHCKYRGGSGWKGTPPRVKLRKEAARELSKGLNSNGENRWDPQVWNQAASHARCQTGEESLLAALWCKGSEKWAGLKSGWVSLPGFCKLRKQQPTNKQTNKEKPTHFLPSSPSSEEEVRGQFKFFSLKSIWTTWWALTRESWLLEPSWIESHQEMRKHAFLSMSMMAFPGKINKQERPTLDAGRTVQ